TGTCEPSFRAETFYSSFMNRRMPDGTYGGVRGRGCEAPAYSIVSVGNRNLSLLTPMPDL
ncbi:MAG: hypothetical protein AB7Y74_14080, partial [Syntrophorhabdus sp.]